MVTVGARYDSKRVYDYVVYGERGKYLVAPNFVAALKQAAIWAAEDGTDIKIYNDSVDQIKDLV